MEIDKTIIKWFNETGILIHDKIRDFGSIDGLCETVLHSTKDYCCTVLLLVQSGNIMPAKALLRCLCELSVKLNWCLVVPDNIRYKKSQTIVKQKIRRWEKDTLCRNIEALGKFRDAVDGSVRQEIGEAIEKLKQEPLFTDSTVKRLPKFMHIIGQLPDMFKNEVYPLLYLSFNNAVHLDVTSLVDDYMSKSGKQSGPDSTILAKYCVAHAFHVNSTIRKNYKIDISDIKQEYHDIMNNYFV